MLYMQSQANSDGNLTLTVNFKLGVDGQGPAAGGEPRRRRCRACRRTCSAWA